MEDTAPRITQTASAEGPCVTLLGAWTAARLAEPAAWSAVNAALRNAGPVQWDLRQVQSLDHTGAQLLWNAWGRKWPLKHQLLSDQQAMLDRVASYTPNAPAPAPQSFLQRARSTLWLKFLGLGGMLFHLFDHGKDLVRLLGQLALDIGRLLRAPHKGPWRDVSGHMYRIGASAMPITALVGFLIGVVLAYLMSQQLRQFGLRPAQLSDEVREPAPGSAGMLQHCGRGG